MNSAAFQLHKVRRMIRTLGRTVRFEKDVEDQFHEPTGEKTVAEFQALMHEAEWGGTLGIEKQTSDSAVLRTKPAVRLIALWEDCQHIDHQYQAIINSRTFRIDGIRNLDEANLVADISLEEVQA